jgi:hypothetical protein
LSIELVRITITIKKPKQVLLGQIKSQVVVQTFSDFPQRFGRPTRDQSQGTPGTHLLLRKLQVYPQEL